MTTQSTRFLENFVTKLTEVVNSELLGDGIDDENFFVLELGRNLGFRRLSDIDRENIVFNLLKIWVSLCDHHRRLPVVNAVKMEYLRLGRLMLLLLLLRILYLVNEWLLGFLLFRSCFLQLGIRLVIVFMDIFLFATCLLEFSQRLCPTG